MSCNHIHSYTHSANIYWGTFLVVQWLRILLPVQGTRVWCLVWEDSTWCGATKAHVPQLLKPACSRARALQQESSPHSPQLEKTHAQQWRPSAAKKKCSYWVTTMCSGICPYVCFRLLGSRRHIWSDITPMKMLCRCHYYMKIRYYHVSLSLWAELAHRFQSQYYEITFKFSGMHTQFAHWCCPAFSHSLVLCFLSVLYSLGKKRERNRLNIFTVKKISFLIMLNPQMDNGELYNVWSWKSVP